MTMIEKLRKIPLLVRLTKSLFSAILCYINKIDNYLYNEIDVYFLDVFKERLM